MVQRPGDRPTVEALHRNHVPVGDVDRRPRQWPDCPAWVIAKQTEKATVQLDVEPTAHLDLATLPAQIREALTEQPNGDRSVQEYHFVARCIEASMTDADILAAVQHYPPAAARGDVERHAALALANAKR